MTMIVGFLSIIIKAFFFDFAEGDSVFDINSRGGRLILDDFRIDPTIRHTFWSIVVAGIFSAWGPLYAVNQTQVQRYKSCRSIKEAQKALYINSIMISLIGVIIPGLGGLAMYAYFAVCDPVSAEWVSNGDQLMAYLELNVMSNLPGFAGLYLAGAFSGTLSSSSSAMNSLSGVFIDDFLDPLLDLQQSKKLKEETFLGNYNLMSKLLTVIFGLLIFIASIVAPLIGGNIVQAALSINATWSSPILGLFIMALYVPFSEKWGATLGTKGIGGVSSWTFLV